MSEPLINDYCPIPVNSQNLTKINLVFLASFEAGCHPVVMYNSPLSLGQWVTMDYEMAYWNPSQTQCSNPLHLSA